MGRCTRAWVGLALLAALLLAGCARRSAQEPSAGTPAGTGEPVTLHVSLNADPPRLDPHLSTSAVDRQVLNNIFDKLVEVGPDLSIQPELAERWEVTQDGRVYTFYLRQGVKFHDGTDFDAEAVKFNFERMLDPQLESPRFNEVSLVDRVEVVDRYTVRIVLKAPFSPFLGILTDRAGMMVSPAAVRQYGDQFLNHPVGTGAFRFVERTKGDRIVLERNPEYWRQGLPKVDRVVYRVISDENVAVTNLLSGEIDILEPGTVPPRQVPLLQQNPQVQVGITSGLGWQGIWLNVTRPPFDNVWLRRAVDAGIDRAKLVEVVFGDTAEPGYGPFPPQSPYNDGTVPPRDPAKAREYLAKAGHPQGFSFTALYAPSPLTEQVGQVLQNMLSEVGIEVKLEAIEWGQLLDRMDNLQYEAALVGWSGRAEADQNVYAFFYTGGGFNNAGYSNPEVDRLLDRSRVTTGEERAQAYRDVLAILRSEVPYVFLYHPKTIIAWRKGIEGVEVHPDGMVRLEAVSKGR